MQRPVPALVVAALLLFAPTVAAVQPVSPSDAARSHGSVDDSASADGRALQTVNRSVSRGLHLADPGASNVTVPETDTSALLDVQASGLRGQFEVYRFQERMAGLDSRDAKRELFRRTFANVSERTEELKASAREARLAYVDGDTTANEFVAALARVSARASATEAKLTYIQRNFGDTFPEFLPPEISPLRAELHALQGPVRQHAVDVLRGETSPNRLYVAASGDGTTLSMIKGRTHLSQTTRWDNLDPAIGPVGDARAEIYPVLAAAHSPINFTDTRANRRYTSIGPNRTLFSTLVRFDYGRASGYFDGSTGSLFYEQQELFLDSLPNDATEQRPVDDRVLTVNRTFPGGPLQVSLTNRTGVPLDGTVLVNGESVGSTGFDGSLWTLGRAGTYEVTVVHEGERVEMTVTAVTADATAPSES